MKPQTCSTLMMLCGLAASLAATAPATAQSLEVGAVAGITRSRFLGDDSGNSDPRSGLMAGGQLVVRTRSFFGFQTGLIYGNRGAAFTNIGVEGFMQLGYLEIPAMIRMSPEPYGGSNVRFVATGGVTLGLRINCSAGVSSGGVSLEADCDDEQVANGEIKNTDFGWTAGIALDVPVGSRFIVAPGVRYIHGLTSIDASAENGDVRNAAYELSLALRMRAVR